MTRTAAAAAAPVLFHSTLASTRGGIDAVACREDWSGETGPAGKAGERKLAHVLKREAIAAVTGESPAELRFVRETSGRLRQLGPRAVEFSLSHSSNAAMVLVGGEGPGVDIQCHRPVRNPSLVAESVWPRAVSRIPLEGERDFFARWTLVEALGKSLGCGLSFLRERAQEAGFERDGKGEWRLQLDARIAFSIPVPEGYSAAACLVRRTPDPAATGALLRVVSWSLSPRAGAPARENVR